MRTVVVSVCRSLARWVHGLRWPLGVLAAGVASLALVAATSQPLTGADVGRLLAQGVVAPLFVLALARWLAAAGAVVTGPSYRARARVRPAFVLVSFLLVVALVELATFDWVRQEPSPHIEGAIRWLLRWPWRYPGSDEEGTLFLALGVLGVAAFAWAALAGRRARSAAVGLVAAHGVLLMALVASAREAPDVRDDSAVAVHLVAGGVLLAIACGLLLWATSHVRTLRDLFVAIAAAGALPLSTLVMTRVGWRSGLSTPGAILLALVALGLAVATTHVAAQRAGRGGILRRRLAVDRVVLSTVGFACLAIGALMLTAEIATRWRLHHFTSEMVEVLGSFDDMAAEHPPRARDNATARELMTLGPELGISLVPEWRRAPSPATTVPSEVWIWPGDTLERWPGAPAPDVAVAWLEEHAALLARVRAVLLEGELPAWRRHAQDPAWYGPPRVGASELFAVLLADALVADRGGDEQRALEGLQATWRIVDALRASGDAFQARRLARRAHAAARRIRPPLADWDRALDMAPWWAQYRDGIRRGAWRTHRLLTSGEPRSIQSPHGERTFSGPILRLGTTLWMSDVLPRYHRLAEPGCHARESQRTTEWDWLVPFWWEGADCGSALADLQLLALEVELTRIVLDRDAVAARAAHAARDPEPFASDTCPRLAWHVGLAGGGLEIRLAPHAGEAWPAELHESLRQANRPERGGHLAGSVVPLPAEGHVGGAK